MRSFAGHQKNGNQAAADANTIIGDKMIFVHTSGALADGWPAKDDHHEIVLQSSKQCLPMIRFDQGLIHHNEGKAMVEYIKSQLQQIMNTHFNRNLKPNGPNAITDALLLKSNNRGGLSRAAATGVSSRPVRVSRAVQMPPMPMPPSAPALPAQSFINWAPNAGTLTQSILLQQAMSIQQPMMLMHQPVLTPRPMPMQQLTPMSPSAPALPAQSFNNGAPNAGTSNQSIPVQQPMPMQQLTPMPPSAKVHPVVPMQQTMPMPAAGTSTFVSNVLTSTSNPLASIGTGPLVAAPGHACPAMARKARRQYAKAQRAKRRRYLSGQLNHSASAIPTTVSFASRGQHSSGPSSTKTLTYNAPAALNGGVPADAYKKVPRSQNMNDECVICLDLLKEGRCVALRKCGQ